MKRILIALCAALALTGTGVAGAQLATHARNLPGDLIFQFAPLADYDYALRGAACILLPTDRPC